MKPSPTYKPHKDKLMNYPTTLNKKTDDEETILIITPLLKSYLTSLSHLKEFNNTSTLDLIEDELDEMIISLRENDYNHLTNEDWENELEDDKRDEIISNLERDLEIFYSLL